VTQGRALGERPQVAVPIVSSETPWRWLSISGRVTDIGPGGGLARVDRMSRKYTGQDYPQRTPREILLLTIDRVSHSAGWG
jgi:hypothetical protein